MQARCGAKTRDGDPCKNPPVTGSRRCRMHGGPTPRGRALPQTTHGRYSKDLPTRLAARYQEAQADPDLLNLNDEIRLTYALLVDALKGIDTGESGRLWRSLKAEWDALKDAQREKDSAAIAQHLNAIGSLITRGLADYAARVEVLDIIDRRRKLVESEGKRRQAMQQMITAERAMLLISAIVDVVMRHVDDPATRAAISADIGALYARDVPAAD